MRQFRSEYGLLIAIVAVLAVTTIFNSAYLTKPGQNAAEILRQTSLLGIFALGAAIVIISGGIDLSSGAVIAFSGSICAEIFLALSPLDVRGSPDPSQLGAGVILAGITGALVVGFLIGTLHAWLITAIGLPPFVATLASLVGLRSLAKVLNQTVTAALGSQSIKIYVYDKDFTRLGGLGDLYGIEVFGIELGAWLIPCSIFLLLSLGFWFLMNRTVVGRHLYAMGGNEQAARLSGIRTERLKWLAYCIGAMTASLAGVLYTAEVGSADPLTIGRGYELNAIAAAVVGGCGLQGGIGLIPGVMLGVLFLRVVIDSVAKLVGSGADDYEGIIVGFLVVLAVAFNELRQTSRGGKKFFPGALGYVAIVALALLAGSVGLVMSGGVAGAVAGVVSVIVLGAVKFIESRRGP
ncbi:MAG: ABC transporter permease [Pirellulales bacterium]|nr:ABC transporter permease [Pirellulales bacterium]